MVANAEPSAPPIPTKYAYFVYAVLDELEAEFPMAEFTLLTKCVRQYVAVAILEGSRSKLAGLVAKLEAPPRPASRNAENERLRVAYETEWGKACGLGCTEQGSCSTCDVNAIFDRLGDAIKGEDK